MKQRLCCSRTESFNSFFYNYLLIFVGRGCTLVDSMPLDRKVVGSNPILAATPGTLDKSFTNSIILYTRFSQPMCRDTLVCRDGIVGVSRETGVSRQNGVLR